MEAVPSYLLPETAEVAADGHLFVGGVDLLDIAAEFGTPTFVYDETHLRNRAKEAVAAFPDGAAYASKAFLSVQMAKIANECGMRIDVATGGELHVALAAGTPGAMIVMHGNNKSTEELRSAIEAGVGLIVLDSFDEIDRIEQLHDEMKPRPSGSLSNSCYARHRSAHSRVHYDGSRRFKVWFRSEEWRSATGRRSGIGISRN